MTVSIVVAVKTWQANLNLEECINKCRRLDYPDFQILVLPDNPVDESYKSKVMRQSTGVAAGFSLRCSSQPSRKSGIPQAGKGCGYSIDFIPTGPVSPAVKRDIALKYAKGDILAFIDDDAYPKGDWLKNAIENFKDKDVAAVAGPAITPPDEALMNKASGRAYESFLLSGKYVMRYLPARRAKVEDYPSCNFLVRRSVMQELGGFNTNFWPGEDTKLCLDITKKLAKIILYDPRVIVWHHRRPLFVPHLKQIASYAIHRGYFVKKYPQTSRKSAYFLPSMLLVLAAAGAVVSVFSNRLRTIYLAAALLYVSIVFIFSLSKGLRLTILVFLGIILSHFTYGFYFLRGILSRGLEEEDTIRLGGSGG